MREPGLISTVRRGLLRQGFDRAYAARVAAELAEHRQDLVDEGLRQGLSETEADTRAHAALGPADTLVREFAARVQSTAWLGRHPTLGFGFIALFATLFWWAIFIGAAGAASGLFWAKKQPDLPPPGLEPFIATIDWIRATSYLVVPALLCWIARRWHCGWKGALWGCLVVAIHNALHSFVASASGGSGAITWGYNFNSGEGPAWLPILAPLAVWTLTWAWNSRPDPTRQNIESP